MAAEGGGAGAGTWRLSLHTIFQRYIQSRVHFALSIPRLGGPKTRVAEFTTEAVV